MDNVKHFYNVNAPQYAEEWYSNDLLLPSIIEFRSFFNIKPRILDLGCGPGQESMRIAQQNADVIGIDFSSESITIAKQKNPNIKFYCIDYFQITSNLGYFDGIFSCSSLIHNTESEIDSVLKLIDTIIKPNGYFLIIFFKGEGQRITYPEINGEKIERIVQLYSVDRMKSIFSSHNYSYIKNGYLDEKLTTYWDSIIFKKD